MSIPDRAQLRLISLPGIRTVGAVALLVILFVCVTMFKTQLSKPVFLILFIVAILPIYAAANLDRKARAKKIQREIQHTGFLPVDPEELDRDLRAAYRETKPHSINQDTVVYSLVGTHDGLEIVLSEHHVKVGKSSFYYTSCAAWTAIELPETIIRQRNLLDKVIAKQDLGDSAFDKQREIKAPELDRAQALLRPMAHWFVVPKHQPLSFRLREIPGKVEMWSLKGHWILVADRGRTNPTGLMTMASFMSAFVHELESRAEPLDGFAATGR